MTYNEKIHKCIIKADINVDNMDKLVYIAYNMGREEAVKELVDKQSKISLQRIFEAERIKYARMIYKFMQIQPNNLSDYKQDFTKTFGNDFYSQEEDEDE